MAPRHWVLTWMPVCPSVRYSMVPSWGGSRRMLPHRGDVVRAGWYGQGRATMRCVKALLTAVRCQKGDLDGNLRRHLELLEQGAAAGARIVVFPEMSLTGSVDPVHWPGHAIPMTHPGVDELAVATARTGVAAL